MEQCTECSNYVQFPFAVKKMANTVANALAREYEDEGRFSSQTTGGPVHELLSMLKPLNHCARTLNLYHKHVARAVWQSAAVQDLFETLQPGHFVVIVDHKQKLEPINMNESSEDYYGKKGMSLLGVAFRFRATVGGPIQTEFLDCILVNGKQNGYQVQTVLGKVMSLLRVNHPEAKFVTILSDNGPALAAASNIQYVLSQNSISWGEANLHVSRWLFFEAQCGKTILDTHFSFVGILIRRFARTIRAVKVHNDVFDALTEGGGIVGTTTCLIEYNCEENDEEDNGGAQSAAKGIRSWHDLLFSASGDPPQCLAYNHSRGPISSRIQIGTSISPHPYVVVKESESSKVAKSRSMSNSRSADSPAPRIAKPNTSVISPHEQQISEALISFTSEGSQTTVKPIINMLSSAPSLATTTSGKGKKKVNIDENYWVPLFPRNWSKSEVRQTMELSDNLVAKLKELVCDSMPFTL
jgi:hypothetical protein